MKECLNFKSKKASEEIERMHTNESDKSKLASKLQEYFQLPKKTTKVHQQMNLRMQKHK